MATTPFSVCKEFCAGGGGTNENGIIVVNTEYESADAIPVFTKTGSVAKKLEDVHCGVFKVSFKESKYNGVSTALIFQTTWWGPTNNATENCYQLMYECNGLFRIREEITITVFKTLAWKAIDISNKKTVINNRADDESYPTTLAVKKFVDAHTSNGDIHVTLEDKQKWNDKYTKKEVNSKFALIENGIIEVKETVVGNLNDILVYDKNGNATTDIEDIHTGTFRLFVKYEDENPDVIFIIPDDEYLLMEQRIVTFGSMRRIVQTILMNNCLYTRVTDDLNFLIGEFGEFKSIGLIPIDTLESDNANAPLSANMGRELNEKKENTSNKSDVIDDTADDTKYPSTKAVKDYVDTSAELNTIVNTAEGSLVNITDSANAKLKGLKIFGKTTQAAEPTVENPQPLVNVGNSGSIATKVYGKDLFDVSAHPLLVKQADGSYVNENGRTSATSKPSLDLPYGAYTFSCDIKCPVKSDSRIRINLKDGSYAEDYETSTGDFVHFKISFIGEPVNWYINYNASCEIGTFAIKNAQLEVGSVETEYKPYKEHQSFTLNTPNGLPGVPVTSGGNYTDENGQQWICDEIDLARGKYIKRVAKVIFTGDEKFNLYNSTLHGALALTSVSKKIKLWGANQTKLLSNYFNDCVNGDSNGSTIQFYIAKNGIATIDEFKAFLKEKYNAGNPVIIIYPLAEPIETDLNLTDEEIAQHKALTTHKPVTNIFNDADAHMKVDYVADPKNYIDNKFNELQAALLNVAN